MKKNRFIKILISFLISLFLVISAGIYLLRPVNAYIETPGEADDISRFVRVDGKRDRRSGQLRLVSVFLYPANRLSIIKSHFDPTSSVENRQDVQGNVSDRVYEMISQYQMKSAILAAEQVAFKAAGKSSDLRSSYRGIYVAQIEPKSHFSKKLRIGDTITRVDNRHFENAYGYQNYLADKKAGDRVELTILRDGKTLTAGGKTIRLPGTKNSQYPEGRTGIGISLVDDVQITTKPKVNVDVGGISGPSGGLMFSLQLYSQLSGNDLKRGRNISGTGTIQSNGQVGEIGGIDKKIIAAKRAGSKIFLVPYDTSSLNKNKNAPLTNWQQARRAQKRFAPKMTLIPVRNFNDALNYLTSGKRINTK
ncbi:SepM family pheromone-processing serine protease [Oenococcus alcoholitolerans]|uniref:SepM family pheromone-processing serine protease n=1 Tax=Oenococcus alcoholitolerans TaxID=931074 RepID=UPI003F6F9A4B